MNVHLTSTSIIRLVVHSSNGAMPILKRKGIFGGGRQQTQAPIAQGAIRRDPESTHAVKSFPPKAHSFTLTQI